jgi:hypothetical protein
MSFNLSESLRRLQILNASDLLRTLAEAADGIATNE